MKKVMICFLLLLTWTARAQNFEGTIKWSMNMEITDPAMKAKMAAAQTKAADPEQQRKMKEMQDKMNDPQMKKMMDANPQMKAQMEAAIKMMSSPGGISSMMPTGFTIKIKNDNALTKIDGGMMSGETLYLKDKDKTYTINREAKTYSVMPSGSPGEAGTQGTPPKVTKTTETTKILGYTCTRYNVEITERGHTINESIWTTTEIKDIDFKKFGRARVGGGSSLVIAGVDGVPLRVTAGSPEGTMTMEITEFKKESLSASDFMIPADFKETAGLFGR